MKINKEIKNLEKEFKHLEKKIKHDFNETIDYIKEPTHIKILKIIIILIALGIIGFVIYNNFIISKEFNYFYDIGSKEDARKPYLTPLGRISEVIIEENINYRNLTGHLVYFEIEIPKGSKDINIKTIFKDNFPDNFKFYLGARNQEKWSYQYNSISDKGPVNINSSEWRIRETEFSIKSDNLYIRNGKLSLFLNAEHLRGDLIQTNTQYIPIDYIDITVYKPGMIERMNQGESFWQALKGVMS